MDDDELDLDELMALQEREENANQDDYDENMEALRELEQEMQESKENHGLATSNAHKRPREPLTEPSQMPQEDTEYPKYSKSPSPKKVRRDLMNEMEAANYIEQVLSKSRNKKIFRRIPKGEYQDVTLDTGERFYLRLKEKKDSETVSGPDLTSDRGQRKSGICGIQFRNLLDEALKEQAKIQISSEIQMNVTEQSEGTHQGELLWVEKFRPRSFLHLLSDDGTNRILLHWLKLWDVVVFNKKKKPPRKPRVDTKPPKSIKFKKVNEVKVEEEYDASNRPMQKVALLHGPPGLGKTTLAHVIANHAGYNVVEMNASDDRALANFKNKVEAATQMKSVSSKDQRPNCLIVDEVDGAPSQTINYLISLITKSPSSKDSKGKRSDVLLRPVICICNDLYVPSLRPLKQHCLILTFPPTLASRLSQRLMEISRKEYLKTTSTALIALCEKTDNDIRACLSTLQFFKSKGQELRLSDVHKANVGQKDIQKGLFAVWKELFQIPRGNVKKWQMVNGESVLVEENAAVPARRYQSVLSAVHSCGEYDKLVNGVFENFLEIKFKDNHLQNVNNGHDWLGFFDLISSEVAHSQIYTLMGYAPYALVSSHFLFSTLNRPILKYPSTQGEKNFILNKNKNVLTSVVTELPPSGRSCNTFSSMVYDLLPYVIEIIQPNLRSVNVQLYSSREKQELDNLVRVMRAFSLTYQQDRTKEGQYFYKLDPPIDNICNYPDVKRSGRLTYAIKQLVAHEIDLERMRKEDATKTNKVSHIKKPTSKQKEDQTSEEKDTNKQNRTPSHLQKLQAKQINVKDTRPVDFFGRKIIAKPEDEKAAKEKEVSIVSSDIWFKFKEGYNNAVRKSVKINYFL